MGFVTSPYPFLKTIIIYIYIKHHTILQGQLQQMFVE